ncbi:MAG: efflux RND transporter permease subunit [Bacillota bacterium]|nr:efflux RND transporter permease subunit [Bacillota bacterium]MDW7683894.1 efflux RND transporter permease subunit [Bacillota bacterium]
MFLSQWTIRRPVATLMFMLVIMILGIVSLFFLQLDILPEMNPPVMAVITELHGASAEEILLLVTEPVEGISATVSGIKRLRSVSREGLSLVILEFDWDADMSDVRTELTEKIELLPLPDDAGRPQVTRFDPTQLPLMQIFATTHDRSALETISAEMAGDIKPRLEAVPGVAAVSVVGGIVREIRVELSAEKLYRYQVGISRVAGLIHSATVSMPLGKVADGGLERNLRLPYHVGDVEELKELAVGLVTDELGRPQTVMVGDLGHVVDTSRRDTSITRLNANPAVGLQIQKEGSGNTVAVSRSVHRELQKISDDHPEINLVVALDQGAFIEESLLSSARSLVVGGFIAMLVLLGFLGSLLSTFIVAVAIPFSVLTTFVLLFMMGMTLNIMTLGGLALGVGMFVDNSIVVIENIFRHLQGGKKPAEAANAGAGEVAAAITSSTLTTVVVFLPVVFIGGFTGTIFRELAITVTFSLICSLIVSLTVIPMLAARWLRPFEEDWRVRFRRKNTLSGQILRYGLKRKILVLGLAALLFVASLVQIPQIGTEFLPAVDEKVFSVDFRLPAGTPLAETTLRVERLEQQLLSMREVDQVTALVGSGAGFSGPQAALRGAAGNTAQLIVALREDAPPTLDVMQQARNELTAKKKDDEEMVFNLYSSMFFTPGSSANLLQLTISGPDAARLQAYTADLKGRLADVEGLSGLQSSSDARLPELELAIDEVAALQSGLTLAGVGDEVRRAVQGQLAGRVRREREAINIRVLLRPEDQNTQADLESIPLDAGGRLVPLSAVATVSENLGPTSIIREDQQQSIEITGQVEGRDIGSVAADVLERAQTLDLPEVYEVRAAGTALLMAEGFSSLRIALILSLLLIYMVMAAQFESLRAPLVILFTAPLAVTGVVAALLITKTAFSITAYIGVIILGGIVVNNGIVLVDYIERTRRRGMVLTEAVVYSVRHRVRPVLMTAFTTILGLLPLAGQLGDGTELQAPLARVVIGGLFSATLLTLIVIPVLYAVLHYRRSEKV